MSEHEPSDAALVGRCRDGDEAAWSALVDRYARYVHAIVTRVYRLRDADADDVFQDTFTRVFLHLDRLRADDALRPWLAQTARRLCVDRLRAQGRVDIGLPEDAVAGDDPRIERLHDALAVRAGLATLNETCQEMLDRFFARDQSYRTISEELGIPSGTIASRIARCLTKLGEQLGEGRIPAPTTSGER